jgi:hypothetical protein
LKIKVKRCHRPMSPSFVVHASEYAYLTTA